MDEIKITKEWTHVENSSEAAIGCGILSTIIELSGSSFVRGVACDPSQTGDEAEFIVVGGNSEVGFVYLRCRVDEVVPKENNGT